jgi:D-sedoheptulose 7-phosphate isomerase
MNDGAFVARYILGVKKALSEIDQTSVALAIEWLRQAREAGKTIYSCGNGGSASIASQMVVDMVKGGSYQKAKRFKMLSLTDSVSTLSAYGNDVGYEAVFVEPLRNFSFIEEPSVQDAEQGRARCPRSGTY